MHLESKQLQLYWQTVGWKAHEFGLPPESTDAEVMDFEQKKRAAAQDLTEDATWFQIFCAELKAGITQPEVPTYCDCDEQDWRDNPEQAFSAALAAAEIFID